MPFHLSRYYDIRPKRPGFQWIAFDQDRITPVGRGEKTTKVEAERAAVACIEATARPASLFD